MNAALLSLAIVGQLGGPLVIQVGDRVPVIDVEKTCKESAATDKAMNLDLPQSVANCMRDENAVATAGHHLVELFHVHSRSLHAGSHPRRHRQLC